MQLQDEHRGWTAAARVAGWIDKALDLFISLALVIALLYGGFGLWDTWNVYHNAGVDSSILNFRPQAASVDGSPSIAALQALYPDVRGWLSVDGTNIDYPVMQGSTNSYYLNHAVDGSYSMSGSIFLDSRNAADFSDSYSLVYGHHMARNLMFGEITDFLEDDYFQQHATGWLYLADRTYKIYWFACVETDCYDKYLYSLTGGSTGKDFDQERLDYIQQAATQYRDLGITAGQQLISLSTCLDASTDGRALLIGWLCPFEEGDSEPTL
jgi:sortase B